MLTNEKYEAYVKILKEELVPAMGCTEPISIAYATAKAKTLLKGEPTSALLKISGNILKNAKSVTVPHTGGMKGLKSAFAAGLAGGDPDAELEVLSKISERERERIVKIKEEFPLEVVVPDDAHIFDITVMLKNDAHSSCVRIADSHTNVVYMKRDEEVVYDALSEREGKKADRSLLSVEDIIEFSDTVRIEDVKEILDRQISYNMAIADKAYDYNGVWLFWWDIANGSEYFDYWSGLKTNSGTVVVAGGEYTIPMTTYSGCYAIAFKEVVDTDRSLVWDYTGDEPYEDFTVRREAGMNEVKAKYAEEIAAFESIDATPSSIVFYTSVTELAVALQKAGYISVAELASPQNLNTVYTDANGNSVVLASTAEKYGKITIYYYDTSDSWFMWNNIYNTYNEFQQNLQADGSSSARAYYEVASWTYDVYTLESGEELVLSADLVVGNFAIAVED